MSARVLRKVATNGSSRGKRISKISIFKANFLKQSEAAPPKYLYFLDDFATFSPFLNTLFLEVNARVSDKVVTSGTFRGKQTCKNSIFEAIILNQKQRSATKKSYIFYVDIRMFMPWETTFSIRVHAFHRKQPPMALLEVSEPQKLTLRSYCSKSKTKECDQSNSCLCDSFRSSITCSIIYFLKVSASVPLKVATKVLLELKKSWKLSIFRLLF